MNKNCLQTTEPQSSKDPKTFNHNVPRRSSVTLRRFGPSSVSSVRRCFARCGWYDLRPQFLEEMSHFLGKNPEITKGNSKKTPKKKHRKKKHTNKAPGHHWANIDPPSFDVKNAKIDLLFSGYIHPVISRILRFPKHQSFDKLQSCRKSKDVFCSPFFSEATPLS